MDAPKDVTEAPTADRGNRNARGHFGEGNTSRVGCKSKGGKAMMLRAAAMSSITADKVIEALEKLRELGMAGDVKALVEWLNRAGIRPELMGMDEADTEEMAVRIIERVWGPEALAKNAPSDVDRN